LTATITVTDITTTPPSGTATSTKTITPICGAKTVEFKSQDF
jgi:hypothetical protein